MSTKHGAAKGILRDLSGYDSLRTTASNRMGYAQKSPSHHHRVAEGPLTVLSAVNKRIRAWRLPLVELWSLAA
jgi:hypothetical protein